MVVSRGLLAKSGRANWIPNYTEAVNNNYLFQTLDLCCALAMEEATTLRHRIPLRESEWEWVPEAARVAIPALTARASFDRPRSIPVVLGGDDVSAAAIRNLEPLAHEIVPVHDQMEAMYGWFETLTRLETDGRLETVALSEDVAKALRRIPMALGKLRDEITVQNGAYLLRHGDHGGWPQLHSIVDWTFFLNSWRLLMKRGADQGKVARAVRALAPESSLPTLREIRAMALDESR